MLAHLGNIALALIVLLGAYLVGFTAWAVDQVLSDWKARQRVTRPPTPTMHRVGMPRGREVQSQRFGDPKTTQAAVDRVLWPECP